MEVKSPNQKDLNYLLKTWVRDWGSKYLSQRESWPRLKEFILSLLYRNETKILEDQGKIIGFINYSNDKIVFRYIRKSHRHLGLEDKLPSPGPLLKPLEVLLQCLVSKN